MAASRVEILAEENYTDINECAAYCAYLISAEITMADTRTAFALLLDLLRQKRPRIGTPYALPIDGISPNVKSEVKMNTATPQPAKGLEDEGTADALRAGEASAMDATQGLRREQRAAMISQAAYYRAQRRGFEGGSELDDWLQAEAEIERMLGRG